jgi:hypothetical protein
MSSDKALWYGVFGFLFAFLSTYAIFVILAEPVITMCDTLMLCFMECPAQLKASASDLADRFNQYYSTQLCVKAQEQEEARREAARKGK